MRRPQVAAESGELVADLGDGARWIVAQRGDEEGDAARSVAFVGDLGVMNPFQLSRSLF